MQVFQGWCNLFILRVNTTPLFLETSISKTVSIAARLIPRLLSYCCIFRFLFRAPWYAYAILSPSPKSTARSRASSGCIRHTLQLLNHLQCLVNFLFFPGHWWPFSLGHTAIVILQLRIHSLLRIDFAILHNVIHMFHLTSLCKDLFSYALSCLWFWNICILK